MSKQAMREETERLVKEALERKSITIKQGKTRIESKMRKVRRAKSGCSGTRPGSGAVHV
jgi:hypothetical protein